MYCDRAGVDIPTIEVRFEHLNVQSHVQLGKRALPTITNYMLDILEVIKYYEIIFMFRVWYAIYLVQNYGLKYTINLIPLFYILYFKGSVEIYTKKKKTTFEYSTRC
jgi:hypothetical protein